MTAIATEIERFKRLSPTWSNSTGPMRPLHVVNALRLGCNAAFDCHAGAHAFAADLPDRR